MINDIEIGNREAKGRGRAALIVLLSAFIPLSTDLYLPALPKMAEYLNTSMGMVNMTLITFFIFYAAGALFWGPLSDKYGRKPILLIGLVIYIVASAACAFSVTIYQLILARMVQAVGGGAAMAVATAMVKDSYGGRKRETILAMVQAMVVIAPIAAPILGALLLQYTSWHGVFWVLGGIGVVAVILSMGQEDTLQERQEGSLLKTLGRLGVVLKNPGFSGLLLIFSMMSIPFMAYIASSSYIYINKFGLSQQEFSYFFAANSVGSILGPLIYLKISKKVSRNAILTFCLAAVACSGMVICFLGDINQWWLTFSLFPTIMVSSGIRPPSTNLMLEQQQGDTGSVSSLINCVGLLMGSLGMLVISQGWSDLIVALGIIFSLVGLLCLLMWLVLSRTSLVKPVPQDAMG